jgi:hypothetical protein
MVHGTLMEVKRYKGTVPAALRGFLFLLVAHGRVAGAGEVGAVGVLQMGKWVV